MEAEIGIAIISIVLLAIGLLYLEKSKRLQANGIAVQSVIIKNIYKVSDNDSHGTYTPVVKFLTQNKEWITQELNISRNPPRTEGTIINILYDPKNTQEIQINSALHLMYMPWLLTIMGVVGLAFFCLELFEVINVL